MGVWDRMRGFFGGVKEGLAEARAPADAELPKPPGPPPPPAPPPGPPPGSMEEAEAWLGALITVVAEGRSASDVASPEFWARIDTLIADGHTRLAAEWLDKFAVAVPEESARDKVRLRAVDLRTERGELAEALPHLEALAHRPAHAARAQFLLGEHHRRQGDTRRALRHFEAVLALDVDYPNARVRVTALSASLGGSQTAPAAVDETIAGVEGRGGAGAARYRLMRELGRGACGVVYLARDAELERDVAVKLLHPHLNAAAQAAARARFFDEARVAAALRHPHIIAILDLDEDQRRIVMEFAAGGTLRDRLRAGALPPLAALERHVEILQALGAAHRQGVVHRDLKPANLLYRRDPDAPGSEIVLTDFGIAHLAPSATPAAPSATPAAPSAAPSTAGAAEGGARRASDRDPVGTLGYMAPEQRRGEDLDGRADLYAAAVILYECLAGMPPWDRDRQLRGIRASGDLLPPPRVTEAVGPTVAGPLTEHLLRLGDLDPTKRPGTADALAAARALHDLLLGSGAADSP